MVQPNAVISYRFRNTGRFSVGSKTKLASFVSCIKLITSDTSDDIKCRYFVYVYWVFCYNMTVTYVFPYTARCVLPQI